MLLKENKVESSEDTQKEVLKTNICKDHHKKVLNLIIIND